MPKTFVFIYIGLLKHLYGCFQFFNLIIVFDYEVGIAAAIHIWQWMKT